MTLVRKALDRVLKVVATSPSLEDGMASLFDYCEKQAPGSPLWKRLRKIDYVGDSVLLKLGLESALRSPELTPRHTGFYFGIDGLNMRHGKGIEFGCSQGYDPSIPGVRWVFDCDLYLPELLTDALPKLYESGLEMAGLADYVICFGYTGLALRQALESIPNPDLLGGAPYRAIMWGFHDGDLAILGIIRPSGFERLACFDSDPDATNSYVPEPVPETSIGRFFELQPSLNQEQWLLETDERLGVRWSELQPENLSVTVASCGSVPLRVKVDGPRVQLGSLYMHRALLVADAKTARTVEGIAPADVELIPARITGIDEEYFLLHFPWRFDSEQGFDVKARLFLFIVDGESAGDHRVFRVAHSSFPVVSKAMRDDLLANGMRGRRYQPVLSRP